MPTLGEKYGGFIRSIISGVTIAGGNTATIPPNPDRVGLLIAMTNAGYSAIQDGTGFNFTFAGATGDNLVTLYRFTLEDDGDLVQKGFTVTQVIGIGGIFRYIEYVVPNGLLDAINDRARMELPRWRKSS